MKTNNEMVEINKETGEVMNVKNNVVEENQNYVIKQTPEGKYIRQAKYKDYSSVKVETREEKLWLLQVLEGDEETGNGLKSNIGKTIEVQDIMIRQYDRIDEETGEIEYGVLTYLIDPDKKVYVTSSKTVYFTIKRILDLFGYPHEEGWQNIKIKVGKEKGTNGDIIKVKMVE